MKSVSYCCNNRVFLKEAECSGTYAGWRDWKAATLITVTPPTTSQIERLDSFSGLKDEVRVPQYSKYHMASTMNKHLRMKAGTVFTGSSIVLTMSLVLPIYLLFN